jgi:hypothetical protein
MWKNSLKNVESDKNKIVYENLINFLQRYGTYFLNKPRSCIQELSLGRRHPLQYQYFQDLWSKT